MCEATCEIVWLRSILWNLNFFQNEATFLFIDSQSVTKLAKIIVFHSKRKHVDTKYHYIQTLIIKPNYCTIEDQMDDIITKFVKFIFELGILSKEILDKRRDC